MIDLKRNLKIFGPLEFLVLSSITCVVVMLLWTASTRSEVFSKKLMILNQIISP